MKRFLSFIIALTVIASMFVLPTFAADPGKITWISNEYNWEYTNGIVHNSTLININKDGKGYKVWKKDNTDTEKFANFLYEATTTIIQPKEESSALSNAYLATGKQVLVKFSINKSADVYIGVFKRAGKSIDWLAEEGYVKLKDGEGNDLLLCNENGDYYYLYKKSYIASEEAPAEVAFYSISKDVYRPCPILIDWEDNVSPELTSSSYAFKGTSGEEGDDNVYYYVFSKVSETFDGADYGIEVGGNWYSLVKEDGDKTEYNKALSSGYYGIGIADPSGSLGLTFNAIPQIRFNGGILFTGAPVSVNK